MIYNVIERETLLPCFGLSIYHVFQQNEKELKAVNEKIIAIKKKVFDETEGLVTKIWSFEEGVRHSFLGKKLLSYITCLY